MTEVAELTARLVAEVAQFNQNMESADATVAQAREQIKSLEGDLAGLKAALDSVGSGALGGIRDDAAQADAALKSVRDSALAAGAAARNISTDSAANARAELLAEEYDQIRDTLIEIRAIQADTGASDVAIAKTDLQVSQVSALRDKWIEAAAAAKGAGPSDVEIAKQALMAAEAERTRDALIEAAVAQHGGGGGGSVAGSAERDAGYDGDGLLAGILPGGRRARPAAIFTALGLAASTGPVLAPAAVAGGAALAAGVTTLIGAAATLKLAFDGITSAAFTTQKAFNLLTPVQQDFVTQLRDIQYGFLKPLELTAQRTTLPGITAGIQAAITPASTQALTSGVAAFGGALGGGAKQIGDLFGSSQFANSLGAVIQADAGYLRDFLSIISNLTDAFVHLSQAAIPLTDSLDKGVLAFSKWLDNSIKAAQASGQLAGYFEKAEVALHSLGDLLGSIGDAFGAFFGAVGFQNSLGVIQTFRDVFEGIAQILNQNKTVLRDFFAGAIASAQDILSVIRTMADGLRPLLSTLNSIANLIGGWRVVIDAVAAALTLKLIPGFLAIGPAAETGAAESGILFTTISAGSDAALASVSLLRTAILGVLLLPTAYQFGKNLGEALFGSGGDNAAYLSQLASQAALAPGQFVNAQGQIIGKNGKPTGQIVLPPGDQTSSTINTILPPNINAAVVKAIQDHSKTALAKADAEARAYYKQQEAFASSQDDINTLQGYIQEYTPGGTAPPGLGNTRTTVLTTKLQTALDAATSNVAAGGPVSQEITAINNALAFVNAIKNKSDADYQERTALYNQLAALKNGGSTAVPTGLATLPPGLQGTLSAAQTAAASTSAVSGTFNPQNLANQRALHAQDIAAIQNLTAQISKQAAGSKELRDLEAEKLTLTREEASAQKQITEELKNQKEAAASAKIDKILGISASGQTTPGATALGSRERQILLEDAKRHGDNTAGLVNEPLSELVKTLAAQGALPKSSQEALVKVNDAIHTAIVTGTKLNSTQSQQISALLTQINDTLKGTSYASNYVAPSASSLTAGLGLSPSERKIAEERLASFYGHGGKTPTNLAGAGVPFGAFETTPPPVGDSLTVHGDINLVVQYAGDGSRFVQELRSELIKTTKRNGSQTKGPNAGRRQGL